MLNTFTFSLLSLLLFLGMLGCLDVGRRVGQRWRVKEGENATSGTSNVEGAVLALLGLLLAFAFSGAATRFDARRALIVEEANDIGTAWLRIDTVDAEYQPELRRLFRQHVDLRLEAYKHVGDEVSTQAALDASSAVQRQIWDRAIDAVSRSKRMSGPSTALLLPALNAMFDITNTRTSAASMHPPTVVFVMLYAVALASSLLAGFAMSASQRFHWMHALCYTLALATVFYVVIDMEYPRLGQLRVDDFDRFIVEVRR
ncbi:MAG: DUF4239 domain-containing protein, partial [Proteobacteria bacterium]|nr:DUF4239 domain-containing protein [Pseudomonadota bacterium]